MPHNIHKHCGIPFQKNVLYGKLTFTAKSNILPHLAYWLKVRHSRAVFGLLVLTVIETLKIVFILKEKT